MKNQALFSSKDKSKKLRCRLLQFLFGALRVEVSIVLSEIKRLNTDHNEKRFNLHDWCSNVAGYADMSFTPSKK